MHETARSATSASTPTGSTTSCSAASRRSATRAPTSPRPPRSRPGLPDTVAGVQLNRFCASGLEAVNIAAQKVASGWEDLVFAGGVESMSRVPMGSDGGAWAMDPETNYDTSFIPQGVGADLIATVEEFSREDVDAYAARSQERAAAAQAEGRFANSRRPGQGPQRARRARPRRVHPPGHDGRDARQAQAVVRGDGRDGRLRRRRAAEVPLDREDQPRPHAGQLVRHRRRRLAAGDRQRADRRRARPDSRGRGSSPPRSRGADPTIMLTGPAPASQEGAGEGRHHRRRPRPGRDQRGVRRRRAALRRATWASTWRRSTSTAARSPWAIRSARPAA